MRARHLHSVDLVYSSNRKEPLFSAAAIPVDVVRESPAWLYSIWTRLRRNGDVTQQANISAGARPTLLPGTPTTVLMWLRPRTTRLRLPSLPPPLRRCWRFDEPCYCGLIRCSACAAGRPASSECRARDAVPPGVGTGDALKRHSSPVSGNVRTAPVCPASRDFLQTQRPCT